MPQGDNELWDRGRPSQPGDNAGSIARQTVCKWRSHRERKFFVLSLPRVCADDGVVRIEQRVPVTVAHLGGATCSPMRSDSTCDAITGVSRITGLSRSAAALI